MEYTFIEKNDLNGNGETKMCPAPVACPQISYKEFLEECKRTMRMSEAEVDGSEAVRCPQMGGGRKMYVFRLVD